MPGGTYPNALELSEEEAFALLMLCMTSTQKLDATSEKALTRLANFCKKTLYYSSHHIQPTGQCKLEEAG